MKIIDWIKENIFTSQEMDELENDIIEEDDYVEPKERPCHNTLVYRYAEKYINALNPTLMYDVKEELKSGAIITHRTNITWREAKDYVRMIWIDSCPPNIISVSKYSCLVVWIVNPIVFCYSPSPLVYMFLFHTLYRVYSWYPQ